MRLGLFGGSFDPVHQGHLMLAECCREQCRLDQVRFLPAGCAPHKQTGNVATGPQRIEMLQLATAGHRAFTIDPFEIEQEGTTYTVKTLEYFAQTMPEAELFFLVGADMLHDLPNWREAARVCELAVFVSVRRSGEPEPDFTVLEGILSKERIELFRQHQVQMPEMGLSSTMIRRRVAEGGSIRYWVPRAVEEYIAMHGLYR
ncbi:MAG: nicotinate-nucleotide adenylyltransferase [Planctomycetia bacterium]|jgi:nicotinate-nucleotide adenylyltransferase